MIGFDEHGGPGRVAARRRYSTFHSRMPAE